MYISISIGQFSPLPVTFTFSNHEFVFYICDSIFVLLIRSLNLKTKEIFKTVRWKKYITYGGKPIQMAMDFSPKTMEARECGMKFFQKEP